MANPPVNEWADFMPQTITVEPWVSYAGGGAGSNFGAGMIYQCRIEMGNHLVVDTNHKTVTARGTIFLMSTAVIGMKDRITLPAGYVPRTPPVLTVDVEDDETGNHHVTVHFGPGQ